MAWKKLLVGTTLCVLLGSSIGFAISVITTPVYAPISNAGIVFQSGVVTVTTSNFGPNDCVSLTDRSSACLGSILIYNGSRFYRYAWPCAPVQAYCSQAPGPFRYFTLVGEYSSPDEPWNGTRGVSYYALPISDGGTVTIPMNFTWTAGGLYTFFFQSPRDGVIVQTSVNAPVGKDGNACVVYDCAPHTITYGLISFVSVGAVVGGASFLIPFSARPKETPESRRKSPKVIVIVLVILVAGLLVFPVIVSSINRPPVSVSAVNTKVVYGPGVAFGSNLKGPMVWGINVSGSVNPTAAGSEISLTLSFTNKDGVIAHEITFISVNAPEFFVVNVAPSFAVAVNPNSSKVVTIVIGTLCTSVAVYSASCGGPTYSGPLNLTVFTNI